MLPRSLVGTLLSPPPIRLRGSMVPPLEFRPAPPPGAQPVAFRGWSQSHQVLEAPSPQAPGDLGAGFLWIVSFLGRSRGHSRWLTRKKSSMAGLFHVTGASLLQPSSRAQRQKALPLRSGSRKMELGITHPVGQTDMRVPAPPHASCSCESIRRYLGVREASRCQGACGPPKGQ